MVKKNLETIKLCNAKEQKFSTMTYLYILCGEFVFLNGTRAIIISYIELT